MKQKSLIGFLIAATILAFSSCQKPEKARILGLVTVVSGKMTVNGTGAKSGDSIQENALIKVEDASRCELTVKVGDSSVQIKIIGPSELRLTADDLKKEGRVEMSTGKGLFEVEHLQTGRFSVASPVAIASVRGTKFTVTAGSNGNTKILVHEGIVGVRVRSEALEALPETLKQKSKVISGMLQALDVSESPIAAGSAIAVTREQADGIVERVPGLKAVLQSPATRDYISAEKKGSGDPASSILAIDAIVATPEADAAFRKSIEEIRKSATTLQPQKVEEDEKRRDLKEFDTGKDTTSSTEAPPTTPPPASTSLAQKEQEYNQLIARKGPAVSLIDISQVMGKQGESVKLKSGEVVQGVLYQEGTHYIIFTPSGKRVIQESELAEVKF